MELTRLDLNLLLVFHHLLREKRVSTVAAVLGMSQPAVSSALGRLRTSLGDALFLRTQHGMAPTPYALQLAEPIATALEGLQQALNVRASFDPVTSDRCFTLAMTDVGEMYFLPVLVDAMAKARISYCRLRAREIAIKKLKRLTPTELDVAKLLAAGHLTKKIAAMTNRSESTVKIHRARIMQKLEVASPATIVHLFDML